MCRFYTIGHSMRTLSEMMAILKQFGISQVADVRTVPRSRKNAHFNSAEFDAALREEGIAYRHFKELGGLRRPDPQQTCNLGWRNTNFRGYADYMQTEEFVQALERLLAWATAPT